MHFYFIKYIFKFHPIGKLSPATYKGQTRKYCFLINPS